MEALQSVPFGTLVAVLQVLVLLVTPALIKHVASVSIEKGIDMAFDKHLEKYKDGLSRASAARQVMLEREMDFFKSSDKLLAELVPLIQDVRDIGQKDSLDSYSRDCVARLPELAIELKDVVLRYEPYVVNRQIIDSLFDLIKILNDQLVFWCNVAKAASSGSVLMGSDNEQASKMCDEVLRQVALIRAQQAKYLKSISGAVS